MLFSMGITFYTTRVVLATLGFDDFGIYNVVGSVLAMFAVLKASMSTSTSRFLTFALGREDKEEFRKTFSAALTIHVLIAFLFLVLAETAGLWYLENIMEIPPDRMNAARAVYQLSIVSAMVTIIQVPYNAAIISHERMNIYAYIEILNVCLKLGIVYLLSIGHWDQLIFYAVLMLLVSCLITGVYRLYCVKRFKECTYKFEWDRKVIYPMLTFSGWDTLGNGAVIGATQGVNLLLNSFFGILVNTAYGVCYQINNAAINFVRNFQMAVNPQIVKNYAAGKLDDLRSLILQNAKISFVLMWLLFLPISLNLELILQFWLGEVPEYAATFCRLVLIQSLISCVQRPFVMTIHATGRMKVFQLTTGTVLLSVLPASWFFLKAGGAPHIPFLVYIAASAIELCVELYLVGKWIKLSHISLFKKVFVPILLIIACTLPVSALAAYYLPFLLAVAVSGLSVCVSAFYIAFDKETRSKVLQYAKNILCHTK
jgi:O-antigen/teichoic acid export membrane protein